MKHKHNWKMKDIETKQEHVQNSSGMLYNAGIYRKILMQCTKCKEIKMEYEDIDEKSNPISDARKTQLMLSL